MKVEYVPYFYIIQHIKSGMYYAGSRFINSKNRIANPIEFWTEGGYFTSSDTIKKICEIEGTSAFIIKKIKTFTNKEETYLHETKFLQKVKARSNPKFLNRHENELFPYGSDQYQQAMLSRYGVTHPLYLDKNKDHLSSIQKELLKNGNHNWQLLPTEIRTAVSSKVGKYTRDNKLGIHAINADPELAKQNSSNAGKESFKKKAGFHARPYQKESVGGTSWWTNIITGKRKRSTECPGAEYIKGMK
jgi:hypothetical protein